MDYRYDNKKKTLYLTIREFALAMKVAERTLHRWMRAGLPRITVGDHVDQTVWIPAAAARRWVREYMAHRWQRS